MKQFSIFFFFVAAFFFVASCKKEGSMSSDNTIKFDTIRSAKTYYLDNDSTKPSCNLKLIFEYPTAYSDNAILDSIQKIFISVYIGDTYKAYPIHEAFTKFENQYVEDYKKDAETFYNEERFNHDDPDEYFSYYETITNEIKFNKENLLSFQINESGRKASNSTSFLGLKNYVINLQTGSLIVEEDIFLPDYQEAFTKIFQDYLLKTNKVNSISQLEDLGYYGLEEMIPNNNFLLDNKGITYLFNKGECLIYQKEPIEIFVAYENISALLKEDSPISKFLKK